MSRSCLIGELVYCRKIVFFAFTLMATKYQEFYQLMYEENKELFDYFSALCENYERDPEIYKERFDEEGKKVMRIMQDWDRKLCKKMDRTGKGNYSTAVSQKFWDVIKKKYPRILEVGVKKS